MPKHPSYIAKYLFLLPLILILGLAYCRYTYIIDLNLGGEPWLIEIKGFEDGMMAKISPNSMTNIKSILVYWVLFLLGNVAFFSMLYFSVPKLKVIVALYLLISFASAIFFFFGIFLNDLPAFSSIGSMLKNFLLSPIFTAVVYILIKHFRWFDAPT